MPVEGDAQNVTLAQEADTEIQLINAIKLPCFLQTEPELWFTQVDGILHLNRITSDISKYYTIITALDSDTLRQVSDIAKKPPAENKYDKLKKELINRFSESKEKQLSKLLNGLELGNKKPSQLLREMRELAGVNVSTEGLQTLWYQRMPSNIRCILSACNSETLDKLADIADRIHDNLTPAALTIAETSFAHHENKITLHNVDARLRAIEGAMQNVMEKLAQIVASNGSDRPSRAMSRNNNRSRSRNTPQNQKVCYYHIRFGNAATKCRQPCEFGCNPAKKTSEN